MNRALLPDSLFLVNRRIWWCVACLITLDIVWLLASRMPIDLSQAILFFWVLIGCIALSAFYRYVRRDDYLFFLGQITAQLLLAILSMGILSYLGQRLNLPLWDESWIAIDSMIGFDWQSYMGWVDSNPTISAIYTLAYFSSGPQIVIIIALLFISKHVSHIQRYILALIITAIITIFFASVFPSLGAYVFYDVDIATTYQNIHPAAGRVHEAPLLALRSGEMTSLVFPLEGLITFPSFHSALSILLIYASWPVHWLRSISIILNIIILFATPVDGGHWLTDVIGGVAIAAIGISLTRKWLPPTQTNPAA